MKLKKNKTIRQLGKMFLIAAVFAYIGMFIFPVNARATDSTSSETVEELLAQASGNTALEILGLNEDYMDSIDAVSEVISTAISGIAMAFMLITIIVAMLKELSKGDASMEMWLKIFLKAAIGLALIFYTQDILGYINDFGNWLVKEVGEAANLLNITGMDDVAKNPSFVSALLNVNFAEAGVAAFLMIYIKIISYTLIIELYIRKSFALLAVASIVHEGLRSPGVRYFKKYFAIYVKMAIIIVTFKIGCLLAASGASATLIEGNGVSLLLMLFIIGACTAFIGKGCTLADEIVLGEAR